jgi:uncharacterized protein (DUF608 family)
MVIGSGVVPREISWIGSVAGPQFDHENPRRVGSWKQLRIFINWVSRQNFIFSHYYENFNNKHNDSIVIGLYHFAFWTISTSSFDAIQMKEAGWKWLGIWIIASIVKVCLKKSSFS